MNEEHRNAYSAQAPLSPCAQARHVPADTGASCMRMTAAHEACPRRVSRHVRQHEACPARRINMPCVDGMESSSTVARGVASAARQNSRHLLNQDAVWHVCSPLMDMPCAFTRTPHAGSQREALSSDRPSEKRIGDVQKSIWSLVAEREGHKVVVADILRFQASRTQ